MRRRVFPISILLVFLASTPAWGRGGGGCLAKGTPILTPTGSIAIEKLRPGDPVLSISDGKTLTGRVQILTETGTDHYLEISAGIAKVTITSEHPVMVGPGEYRIARLLKVGDTIYVMHKRELRAVSIHSIQRFQSNQPAYNVIVVPGGTFIPANIVVHNKGCFLPESLILRSNGTETPISAVRRGDELLAFSHEGRPVRTKVKDVIRHRVGEYILLRTDRQTLKVTSEHPFYVGRGTFKTIESLKVGDVIFAWDGQSLSEQRILALERVCQRVQVFNLLTDHPNTFFAGGFAVHNKGGGSSRSSSSRSSSSSGRSSPDPDELVIILKMKKPDKSENLDYVYSPASVAPKAAKTGKLLDFLSRQDPSLSPRALRTLAENTFRKLQECWEKREYSPMKPLLMDALFVQHSAQLRGLIRNHEINRIDDLKVERIDLVNVRYTEKADQREFTALITASARDYYVDDRTNKFLRGDKSKAQFQEFWTFHRSGDKWLLREIEQAGESDILKDENYVEMLTDQTIQGIYDDQAAKEGEAGPWLEKGTGEKATRIDRLLNFLMQTDKLWDRQQMLERARQIFLSVFLAQESGDPVQVPVTELFRDVAESLRKQITQRQMDNITVEYRNLCVRKAELILVRNYTDPAKDEYTVRISAHAQKIIRKGRQVTSEQRYVTPFEEYWTFGRLDGKWKLKEVLPPARGEKMISEENVDEDSSAGQLQWYYRQTRAT